MDRRQFLALAGGVVAVQAPAGLAHGAASERHIGILMPQAEGDSEATNRIDVLREQLAGLGWVVGKTIRFSYRWGASSGEKALAAARELVGLSPDLVFTVGTPATVALKRTTHQIPVVFAVVVDPVGAGIAASLAKPGGNVTGFSTFEPEIGSKWVEILREAYPPLRRVGVIHDPTFRGFHGLWQEIESTAPKFGLEVRLIDFRTANDDVETGIGSFATRPGGGIVVLPTAINSFARERIFQSANRHRLPAIYPFKHYALDGGMMAYGFDPSDLVRRAASYVDRILKGEEPANLPIQAPNGFELVINLKAAKAAGQTIPQALMDRATEVVE